jgi:hypothetical protein
VHHTEADRVLAARHVAEGDRRVARQRDLIEESRRNGHPTRLSELALATMLETLDLMREHLAQIEADLTAQPSQGRKISNRDRAN